MPGFIAFAGIVPHPPLLIPDVGAGYLDRVQATQAGIKRMAVLAGEASADSLVMITPHSAYAGANIGLLALPRFAGDFSAFGAPQVALAATGDQLLADEIFNQANLAHIPVERIAEARTAEAKLPALDHGLAVFLYFLREAGVELPLTVITYGQEISLEEYYYIGEAVQKAAIVLKKRIAFIASADLSHRLTPDAPAGYNPRAAAFDEALTEGLMEADPVGIMTIDRSLRNDAGECGYRAAIALLGVLNSLDVQAHKLSYEGPFGVGYLNLYYKIKGLASDRNLGPAVHKAAKVSRKASDDAGRELPRLARAAVTGYVGGGQLPGDVTSLAPHWQDKRAGAFVSIKRKGDLRGCIGTLQATTDSIADEVISNAVSAATRDPRFSAVRAEELGELSFSVDILHAMEPVADTGDLHPLLYGVVIRTGNRTGLLLPNLAGVDTPEEQLDIARRKAGIEPHEDIKMWRFRVDRYNE